MSERCGYERAQVVRGVGGWRGVCPCGWAGPVRSHPLDCGPDLLDHQNGTPEAVTSEAVTPTKGTRPSVA